MTDSKTNPKNLQVMNVLAFILVLVVNGLSNALPLNGRTAGEISDSLPSFLHPPVIPFLSGG